MSVVWIDKIEAARRQIKTAVRLFFQETEPVAVHTLVASAHQILIDIGLKRGIYGALKSAKLLQSAEGQEYLKSINFAFNYMKHADRDDDMKLNIEPLQRFTSDVLLDAVVLLQRISGDIPVEARVFWTWFSQVPRGIRGCSCGWRARRNEATRYWQMGVQDHQPVPPICRDSWALIRPQLKPETTYRLCARHVQRLLPYLPSRPFR